MNYLTEIEGFWSTNMIWHCAEFYPNRFGQGK